MKFSSLLIVAILASCLIISTLMMGVVIGEESEGSTNSIIEIFKAPENNEQQTTTVAAVAAQRTIMEEQPEGMMIGKEIKSVAANSTQSTTVLFSGYSISSTYLAPSSWNYYYIDVKSNAVLTISHYNSYTSTYGLEIYIQDNYGMPSTYQYKKKQSITYSTQSLTYSSTYYTRVYIGVRNSLTYAQQNSGYRFTVSVVDQYVQPKPVEPTTKTYYYSNTGTILSYFLPVLILSIVLMFTLIAQIRRINQLNKRVADLETRMNQGMINSNVEEMMPVMNMPLMASNSLEQTHQQQEEQVETHQPQMVQQPQQQQQPMYPQYIHPQGIPYPMRYYPQVVAFQPQQQQMGQQHPQVVAFQQQQPQQQQNTQAKQ